jgi:REP element-mobilizing transposase RayT
LPYTSGNLVVHLIFSTKQRQPLIRPELRCDLFAYLGGIVRELRGTAMIVNGTADHVHMLVRMRPSQSTADLVLVVKTNSSRWVKAKGNSDFAWQTGYGAFSVSESNVADVTRYIAGQEEHHKKQSFQEFLLFLKKNHVPFEEKYLWD